MKVLPEDFIVEEIVDIELSGEGEHCWLYIKKRSCNTEWLAKRIARFCDIPVSRVSYAGLKDRHAVTSQWFSVHLPGKQTPDWQAFEDVYNSESAAQGKSIADESIQVLKQTRHNRKLQRGALKANRFRITLRDLDGPGEDLFRDLDERVRVISEQGVPNYFGEQRFGRERQNVQQARAMLSGRRRKLPRHKRSLYLSAARSWLFNMILSARVEQGSWNRRLAGDVFMLDGSSACFRDDSPDGNPDQSSAQLDSRLVSHDIHPAIVLWGEHENMVAGAARELEMALIDTEPELRDGLIAARVKAARRASRLIPGEMQGQREGDSYVLSFVLQSGAYATAVLAELITLKD
jgi:tRNA pseudouridine13 synthase